jgi:hypothetical protein
MSLLVSVGSVAAVAELTDLMERRSCMANLAVYSARFYRVTFGETGGCSAGVWETISTLFFGVQ